MLAAFAIALLAAQARFEPGLVGVLIAAVMLVVVGSSDDRRLKLGELGALTQFAAQLAAAAIAVIAGVLIRDLRDPTAGGPFGGVVNLPIWAAVALTLFWIAGMMNTVNFLDGVDGLAGGVVAIAAAVLALVSLRLGQADVAAMCLALAGAALGFLPHNLHPARIFMGTSGAWFLGYMLAVVAIIGGAKLGATLLVIGVPVFDVALLMLIRLLRRQPFWLGDRSHLHHRLLDTGLSERGTVLLYYCLSAAFGLYALAFTQIRSAGFGLKVYGLVILVAVMIGILVVLTQRKRQA